MPTRNELKILQSLPLEIKVAKTKERIREWVNYYGVDGVYVSFSGGKDSTVLLHIVRELYPDIEAVFVNTGLEYPEIQKFVKTFDNVTILRPKMRFDEVIKIYGYPLISKPVANTIRLAKTSKSRMNLLNGKDCDGSDRKSKFSKGKWKPLLNLDFKISEQCCDIMKKSPMYSFTKETKKVPIIATTTEESMLREKNWLKSGCNAFNDKHAKSQPMSFWTEQDILSFIKQNSIKIASVYGEVEYNNGNGEKYYNLLCDNGCKLKCSDCQRTGCIFCGFGAHRKGNDRFVRLKTTHPKQYEYCMGGGAYDMDGLWKPNEKGLGMKHCIDEINKIYGKDFIKY